MDPSRHDEVERKYDVEPATVFPSLVDVDGVSTVSQAVEHELEAVYYDTAELTSPGTARPCAGGPAETTRAGT